METKVLLVTLDKNFPSFSNVFSISRVSHLYITFVQYKMNAKSLQLIRKTKLYTNPDK